MLGRPPPAEARPEVDHSPHLAGDGRARTPMFRTIDTAPSRLI
jgi:hypothetical protein